MTKRRLSHRPRFRASLIALILTILATAGYFAYRYFFVPQVVTIAKLIEDVDGDITFTQTAQQEANGGGTFHNKKTGKTIKVDKAEDLTKSLDVVKSTKITEAQCQSLEKKLINGSCITPIKTTTTVTTPGDPLSAPDTVTSTTLCPGGNTGIPAGSWAATGYGLNASGKHCKTGEVCPQRECVHYDLNCKIDDTKSCGEALATDPAKVIVSSAMGCEYSNTTTNTPDPNCDKPLATCYTSNAAYPSGSTKEGKVCSNGQWVTKYDQTLCDFIYGAGKTTLDSNGKCISKSVVTTTTKDICDGVVCSDGKKCEVLSAGNGWACVVDESKLKPAGATVSSPSECASGEASPTGNKNTLSAKYVCIGGQKNDIVDNASQCISNYALSQTNGKVKCVPCVEGMNNDDRTDSSYFTCDSSGKAIFHNCTTGSPTKASGTWSCPPAPAQPVTPATIDPKTLNNVNAECDGDYASVGSDGKYIGVPACTQVCDKGVDGKIVTKLVDGKRVCDTPKLVADNPRPAANSCPSKGQKKCGDDGVSIMTCSGTGIWTQTSNCAVPFDQTCKLVNGVPDCVDKNTPPAPAKPVTPQPPSNPNLTECSGGICPNQPIIDTPPTNNSNLGEESTSETVADVAGGAVTGALILGGIGCGLGIVAGLATGGLGLPLAAAGCVSFLGPAALAGGTIGGILGFFK